MTLYSEAPEDLPWAHVKPSVLVCWWATLFSTMIILLRVAGRFIRSETLFPEDRMAFLCLIPMYARMGCVHVILIHGTNNVNFHGRDPGEDEAKRRALGSGLVLLSRIFYSATLWLLKNTILEFFKRLSGLTWSKTYQNGVLAVRCVLIATFVAVLISDLAECQPFNHYWQVFPDPGGHCRQGYANLITTGVCNVLTDLLLVILPVPIIIMSQMSVTRKMQLVMLFSMSLLVVIVTLYRIPRVVDAHGDQRLRSLLASIELLIATGVANALVLGSFVRDRGVKKRKFKYGSVAGESVHATDSGNRSRRPTVAERAWGSDEDLVRDVGFGLQKNLRSGGSNPESQLQLPAGPVEPIKPFDLNSWNFPERGPPRMREAGLVPGDVSNAPNSSGPRRVSFFDVGGLLDDQGPTSSSTALKHMSISSRDQWTSYVPPAPTIPAGTSGFRKGSQAILQDLSDFLGPFTAKREQSHGRDTEREDSGSSGTELRDLSPAISPRTEIPPPLDSSSSEPPPYDISSRGRTSTSTNASRVTD